MTQRPLVPGGHSEARFSRAENGCFPFSRLLGQQREVAPREEEIVAIRKGQGAKKIYREDG